MSQIGRRDKSLVSASRWLWEYWWALGIIGIAGLLVLWHVAVVLTTPAGWQDFEAGLQGVASGNVLYGIPGAGIWTVVVFALEFLVLGALLFALVFWRERLRARRPGKGMLTRKMHRDALSLEAVLSPSRDGKFWPEDSEVPREKRAFNIGAAMFGTRTESSWFGQEQHLCVVARTGAGKTYRLMGRAALDAPGALVVTTTKPDLLDLLYTPRSEMGKVWVSDMQDLVGWHDRMRWDFLAGCENAKVARSRAKDLIGGGADKGEEVKNSSFWENRARDVLAALLYAAALDGRTMRDVIQWAYEFPKNKQPNRILSEHPTSQKNILRQLVATGNGADDTVASTRDTLHTAISALAFDEIVAQFEPDEDGVAFDADAFVRSNDTLIIIADERDPLDVSNLASVLLGAVVQAAKNAGRRQASGRLSPPLRLVLDEVANIAPLPDFPAMLSDVRSYGMNVVFAVQGMAQVQKTWGDKEAKMLSQNSAGMLILGGSTETEHLEDISKLAGTVDVAQVTTQMHQHGTVRGQQSYQEQEKKVLKIEEISRLEPGEGLLVTGILPPVVLNLPGWTERPDGDELSAQMKVTSTKRAEHAALD